MHYLVIENCYPLNGNPLNIHSTYRFDRNIQHEVSGHQIFSERVSLKRKNVSVHIACSLEINYQQAMWSFRPSCERF